MVWGVKTPVNAHVSTCWQSNSKVRGLTTAGLGILFVFCAPGQITKASYSSSIKVVENEIRENIFPVSVTVKVDSLELAGGVEEQVKVAEKSLTETKMVLPQKAQKRPMKPVQLASLDLKIPKIDNPQDFVSHPALSTRPAHPSVPPVYKRTPKLQKKLFGSVELRFEDERKIKAWSSVYEKFNGDVRTIKACLAMPHTCSDPVLANWTQELRPLMPLSKFQKMTAINTLVNQRMYADDRRNYGRSDYWASPSEFLKHGGDCEDYAILKFASLLALGVNDQDMRLVVGRLTNGTPHAFLATHIGDQEYILDNRQSQVYLTTNRKDYVPKYSMNLSYRWSHVMPGAKTI